MQNLLTALPGQPLVLLQIIVDYLASPAYVLSFQRAWEVCYGSSLLSMTPWVRSCLTLAIELLDDSKDWYIQNRIRNFVISEKKNATVLILVAGSHHRSTKNDINMNTFLYFTEVHFPLQDPRILSVTVRTNLRSNTSIGLGAFLDVFYFLAMVYKFYFLQGQQTPWTHKFEDLVTEGFAEPKKETELFATKITLPRHRKTTKKRKLNKDIL